MRSVLDKKGQVGNLFPAVLGITLVGILLALVMYIVTQIGGNFTASSAERNATSDLVGYFIDFMPWLGIILLVIGAAVVIVTLIRSFGGRKGV